MKIEREEYENLRRVADRQCATCVGNGMVPDYGKAPGPITYSSCPVCDGTGLKPWARKIRDE